MEQALILLTIVNHVQTILTTELTWTQQVSNTTENLYSSCSNGSGTLIVVGYNNTVLRSTNATTWTFDNYFNILKSVYNVQGDSFTAGYGP
jgi:hypothetical protein